MAVARWSLATADLRLLRWAQTDSNRRHSLPGFRDNRQRSHRPRCPDTSSGTSVRSFVRSWG
jgi:hypothetical protein